MQNEQILRLAERLEKATGPDRALDCAIAEAVGLVPKHHERDGILGHYRHVWSAKRPFEYDLEEKGWTAPAYTASLDAAMTLVENWPAELHIRANMTDAYLWPDGREHGIRGHAATPALALCAAALRSRTGDQSNAA